MTAAWWSCAGPGGAEQNNKGLKYPPPPMNPQPEAMITMIHKHWNPLQHADLVQRSAPQRYS